MTEISPGPTPAVLAESASADPNLNWALRSVAEALRGLDFGAVTLTVQDGVVVQVERVQRQRYQRGRPAR